MTISRWVLSWLLPFLFFFTFCWLVGYGSRGDLAVYQLDYWTATAHDARKAFGLGDGGSYIQYAQLLLESRGFHVEDQGIVRNWAPGFPLILAIVFKLTGYGAYLPKLLLLSATLWAIVLTFVHNWIGFTRHRLVSLVVLALAMLLPEIRFWCLSMGYVVSESTGIAMMVFGLAAIAKAITSHNVRYYYLSAFLMGIAATIKASFDLQSILALLVIAFIAIGASFVPGLRLAAFRKRIALTSLACFAILSVTTAPWKLYNLAEYHKYTLSLQEAEWNCHWTLPGKVPVWADATYNTACVVDPELCAYINARMPGMGPQLKRHAMATLFRHPVAWISHKLKNVNWLWVGVAWKDVTWASAYRWAEAGLYMTFLLFIGLWSLAAAKRLRQGLESPVALLPAIVAMALLAANGAVFLIAHYELRYSLPLKVAFVCLAGICLALGARRAPADDVAPLSEGARQSA